MTTFFTKIYILFFTKFFWAHFSFFVCSLNLRREEVLTIVLLQSSFWLCMVSIFFYYYYYGMIVSLINKIQRLPPFFFLFDFVVFFESGIQFCLFPIYCIQTLGLTAAQLGTCYTLSAVTNVALRSLSLFFFSFSLSLSLSLQCCRN